MAQNTAQNVIDQAKFLTGNSDISNANAVRLLGYSLDQYTYLAITSDGKAQVDDTEESDISRATATLSSGNNKVNVGADFLTWSFVEIEDSNGNRYRLEPFDQRTKEETTVKTTTTGRPNKYDYYGGHFYFNKYADQDYTLRAHFSRAFTQPTVSDLTVTIGIPSIHAEYLALHMATRMAMAANDPSYTSFRNELTNYEMRIQDFYRVRDEDMPQILQAKLDVRK